jgi:hypothetical protein
VLRGEHLLEIMVWDLESININAKEDPKIIFSTNSEIKCDLL